MEVVAFHYSAAPESQEVESALRAHPQHRRHPLVVILQHRLRDPVAAADEDGFAVDYEEFAAVRGVAGGHYLADAEGGFGGVAEGILVVDRQFQFVEGMLSFAQGPPERGVVDAQLAELLRAEGEQLLLLAVEFHFFTEADSGGI